MIEAYDSSGEWYEYFDEFEFLKYPVVSGNFDVEKERKHEKISRIDNLEQKGVEDHGQFSLFSVSSNCKQTRQFSCRMQAGLKEFISEHFVEHQVVSQLIDTCSLSHNFQVFNLYDVKFEFQNESMNDKSRRIHLLNNFSQISTNPSFDCFSLYDFPPTLRRLLKPTTSKPDFELYNVEYNFVRKDVQVKCNKKRVNDTSNIKAMELDLDEFITVSKWESLTFAKDSNSTAKMGIFPNGKTTFIDLTNFEGENDENLRHNVEKTGKVENFPDKLPREAAESTCTSPCTRQLPMKMQSKNTPAQSHHKTTFAIIAKSVPKVLFCFRLLEIKMDIPPNIIILYGRINSFLIICGNAPLDKIMHIYENHVYWKSKNSCIIIWQSDYVMDSSFYELIFRHKVKTLIAPNSDFLLEYLLKDAELDVMHYWNDELDFEGSLNRLPFLNPISLKYFLKKYSICHSPLTLLEKRVVLLTELNILGQHQISLMSHCFTRLFE